MDREGEIRFDGWTLKRDSGELHKEGRRIRLQGQSLRVLEELLDNPGKVVRREDLIARLWPKGVLDFDTALNSAVRRLRRALEDEAGTPRYIETIPRKGYRFVGSIDRGDTGAAVGIRAEVNETCATGADSGAGTRRPGRVWATASVCALAFLLLAVAGDTPERNRSKATSTGAPTAELLARARYFLGRRAPGDLARARDYFERVVNLDPSSAHAFAGISSVYWLQTREGEVSLTEGLPKVKEAAERALQLEPREAEAHHRLSLYNRRIGDEAEADRHERLAREADPDEPSLLAVQASDEFDAGHIDNSIRLLRRLAAVAPLNVPYRYNLASELYLSGRFDEALQVIHEVHEVDPEYRADIAGFIAVLRGQNEAAIQLTEAWPDSGAKWQVLALAYFGLGRTADSERALDKLIALVRETEPLRIAEVFAWRKDVEHAVQWLRVARGRPEAEGVRDPGMMLSMIRYSPLVAPIRSSIEWDQIRAAAGP